MIAISTLKILVSKTSKLPSLKEIFYLSKLIYFDLYFKSSPSPFYVLIVMHPILLASKSAL